MTTFELTDKNRTKEERQNFLKNLSFYFKEYCDNTSIHGLKFLGERKRSKIEKVWWLVFIAVSLYFCIALICQIWQKWNSAPVIVTFATSDTEIWKIPFPAVTVCPFNKVNKSRFNFVDVFNRINNNRGYTRDEAIKLGYVTTSCIKMRHQVLEVNANSTIDAGVNDFLIDVSPDMGNLTHHFTWTDIDSTSQIEEFFTPTLTSSGVCYTFNMLDRDELFTEKAELDYYRKLSINHQPPSKWTLEDGYEEGQLETFPRRTALPGTYGGIELTLGTLGKDLDNKCRYTNRGYKIIVHPPGELPRYHQHYFWLPFDQMVTVSVTPNLMTTSKKLESYEPEERRCYFPKEKSLRFFKIYNQPNCLLECLSNFTYQRCGCVGFYMPREKSTPICGPIMSDCLRQANNEFMAKEAKLQMNLGRGERSISESSKLVDVQCNCLLSCDSIHYDAETSQMDWDWIKEENLAEAYQNKKAHLSLLKIFFKDPQFVTSERRELYVAADFWANFGGLLALFTGFSFISLVEIVYFLTLRILCNVRRYGRYYWSGAEELIEVKARN